MIDDDPPFPAKGRTERGATVADKHKTVAKQPAQSTTAKGDRLTRTELDHLSRVIRGTAKVLRTNAEAREAAVIAEFEQQISAIYKFGDNPVFQQQMEEAAAACNVGVAKAQALVAEECKRLGIETEFRPTIVGGAGWIERGENATSKRRTELRVRARSAAEAEKMQALAEIDRQELALLTELVAGSLVSGEARAFLDRLPKIEALMPALDIAKIEALPRAKRTTHGGDPIFDDED